jgi:hypothetical protein
MLKIYFIYKVAEKYGSVGRFTIFGTYVFKSNREHFLQMSRWSPVYIQKYKPEDTSSSPITPKKKRTKQMKNKVPLKILNMNFQSLKNKKPDLLEIIDYVKPDIIMGTETWLDRNIVMVCVLLLTLYKYDQ